MDKEAREKISGLLSWYGEDCAIRGYSQDKNEKATNQMMSLLKELGYRKVPELKAIDANETGKIWDKAWLKQNMEAELDDETMQVLEEIVQDELDSIGKQIEEANA